jgi:hypothetical protein
MKRTALKVYGVFVVYGIAAALCVYAMVGCKGIQGAAIGGGTGAAVTGGSPQGTLTGAGAGFVVGLWEDITTAISGMWHGLFGGGQSVPPPSPSNPLVLWLVFFFVLGAAAKLYFDDEFRQHVVGFFKTAVKLPKRKTNAPS